MKELDAFNPLKSEISAFVAPAMKALVSDFTTSQAAIDAAKVVRELTKKVEAQRDALVRPLNDQVRKINDYVRQIRSPLEEAESHLKRQLNAFATKQEEIRQAELRKAQEDVARKTQELAKKQEEERWAEEKAAAILGPEDGRSDALEAKHDAEKADAFNDASEMIQRANDHNLKNVRKTTKVRVLDITKVPREYLVVELNTKMALAAYRGGNENIPGLEFYEEVGVAIGWNTRAPRSQIDLER